MAKRKKLSYWQKLQAPEWQRKRAHLFHIFGGYCQYPGCENPHLQIDVHHKVYFRNREPWDYPDWCFQILCKYHHGMEQDRMEAAHAAIASNPQLIQYCIDHAIKDPIISIPIQKPKQDQPLSGENVKSLFQQMREAIERSE